MVAATKKKRGRQRIFSLSELQGIDIDIEEGLLDRGRINRKYSEIGLDAVYSVLDPDLDNDSVIDLFGLGRTRKRGILEQIGRMVKEDYPQQDLEKIITMVKERIEEGYKSKDIEQALRRHRLQRKQGTPCI